MQKVKFSLHVFVHILSGAITSLTGHRRQALEHSKSFSDLSFLIELIEYITHVKLCFYVFVLQAVVLLWALLFFHVLHAVPGCKYSGLCRFSQ